MFQLLRDLLSKFFAFDFYFREIDVAEGVRIRHGCHYKYKSLAKSPFEHVVEILRDSKIYCPRPSELNDKDEGKPQLVVGDITNPAYWPKVEAWVRRCFSHNQHQVDERHIQNELRRITQSRLESMTSQVDADFKSEVEKRYRILSFGSSPVNRHLWESYASSFNGVCVEFTTDDQFGPLYEVTYSDAMRSLDLTSHDDFEHLRLTVLTKSLQWQDEKEARMIFGEPPIDGNQLVLVDQRHFFPPEKLTGLFIGYKVDSGRKRQLLALASSRLNHVRCYTVWPIPWGSRVFVKRIN